MSIYADKVSQLVRQQQKEYDRHSIESAVGELIINMAKDNAVAAELIAQDLEKSEMDIKAAGKQLYEVAKKQKTGSGYCMSNEEAREILRKFYAIPEESEKPKKSTINLLDLL
ncbi:MAG: hypothetical protein ACK5JF_00780 [Oscillospiraceae bacterium]